MDDEKLKKFLNKNRLPGRFDSKNSKEEWREIESTILSIPSTFPMKLRSLTPALMILICVAYLGLNLIGQNKAVSDDQLAEYLLSSADYFNEPTEDDYF